jgi:ketosteroid isomerase-like protein
MDSESTIGSPTDTVLELLDGVPRLVDGDRSQIERLAGLYAEETLVRHPLAPTGDEPLRSREALRHHFAVGPGNAGAMTFRACDVVVHEVGDGETVVVEFTYRGRAADGSDFAAPCVFVVRVCDGLIVESHDYIDHLAMARAAGRLGGLLDALRG